MKHASPVSAVCLCGRGEKLASYKLISADNIVKVRTSDHDVYSCHHIDEEPAVLDTVCIYPVA